MKLRVDLEKRRIVPEYVRDMCRRYGLYTQGTRHDYEVLLTSIISDNWYEGRLVKTNATEVALDILTHSNIDKNMHMTMDDMTKIIIDECTDVGIQRTYTVPNTECLKMTGYGVTLNQLDMSWLEHASNRYWATGDEKYETALSSMIDFIKDVCRSIRSGELVLDEETEMRYFAMRLATR